MLGFDSFEKPGFYEPIDRAEVGCAGLGCEISGECWEGFVWELLDRGPGFGGRGGEFGQRFLAIGLCGAFDGFDRAHADAFFYGGGDHGADHHAQRSEIEPADPLG